MKEITIETPGRICLFGEHQDYLGLPVIAAAINKTIAINAYENRSNSINIQLPNIHSALSFKIGGILAYENSRDYFKSAINVLLKNNFSFSKGIEATVNGTIPINSGTSSSSALLCGWIQTLAILSDQGIELPLEKVAKFAFEAEVIEFGEAGGMMDHYATAVGNIIYLESSPTLKLTKLEAKGLGTFVLGDSLQPKDTINILKWVKFEMLKIIDFIKKDLPNFDLKTITKQEIEPFKNKLSAKQYNLLMANLNDRDILKQALQLFENEGDINEVEFGFLLNKHHENLRDFKMVSTPKIDKMIEVSLKAGAIGAKINGSGGGGCMFAYAPTNPQKIAQAIENEGGTAHIINIFGGQLVSKKEI